MKKSYKTLKNKLDKVFSKFIRLRDTKDGYGKCCTCQRVFPYEEIQAGHYISRTYLAVRWNEQNVHGQCMGCNCFKKGALDKYSLFLVRTYGSEILNSLNKKKHGLIKFKKVDLEMMIEEYENKIKEILTNS